MKLLFQSILSSCLIFGGSLIYPSLVESAIAQDTLQGQVPSVNQLADVQPTEIHPSLVESAIAQDTLQGQVPSVNQLAD
ncbi:carbohydrate porin, partial [Microcoleus sp. AT3-A2]